MSHEMRRGGFGLDWALAVMAMLCANSGNSEFRNARRRYRWIRTYMVLKRGSRCYSLTGFLTFKLHC